MGSFYMEATQINYRRDETLKTVDQKLQELSEESAVDTDIAPVFSKTATYNPGDLVYYKNRLYVCVTQHTGAWAAADFTASTVSAELGSLKSGLTNVDVALSVPEGTGKNVLPITVNGIKALNTSGTWDGNDYAINGITYTIVTDASGNITSITADGTSTDRARLYLVYGNISKFSNMILSGCSNGESNYGIVIQMSSNPWTIYATNRNGDTTISTISSSDSNIFIEIANGKTVENIAFYPMIRDSRISDPTFAPYIPSVESRIEAVESDLANLVYKVGDTINFNSGNGITVSGFLQKTANGISTLYAIIPIDKPVTASNYTLTIGNCYANYGGLSSIQCTVDSVSYRGKQIGSLLVGIDVNEINVPVNSAITITLFGIITFTAS